jgi:hypothetical protein
VFSRRKTILALAASAVTISGSTNAKALFAQAPGKLSVDAFTNIPNIYVENTVLALHTSGWSKNGVGGANYIYDKDITPNYVQNHPLTSAITKNGRGFRLAEAILTAEMFGALTLNSDNSRALQLAIDHIAETGGGQLIIPKGIFVFRTPLKMKAGVDIIGMGKLSTFLHFKGTGAAIDAYGTAENRILLQMRDLCLLGTDSAASAIGIKLAWNQRSLPLLERVRISDFGHHAILFAGSNWLVTFRDVEIHDCGKRTQGSSGIARSKFPIDVQSLADIKFSGLVIESCGTPQSMGGAISFPATQSNPTQGLWIDTATIEGNAGSYECVFENADIVSINQSYFEIAISAKASRSAINLINSNLTLTSCRMASDTNNQTGASIHAHGKSTVHIVGNIWDSDFRYADIVMDPGVLLEGTDLTKSTAKKVRVRISGPDLKN